MSCTAMAHHVLHSLVQWTVADAGACNVQDKEEFDLHLAGVEYLEDLAWQNVGACLDDAVDSCTEDMMKKSGLHASSDWQVLRGLQDLDSHNVRSIPWPSAPCRDC